MSISLSHSGGVCLCAVSDETWSIGCDIEIIESRPENFLSDFLSVRELSLVRGCAPDRQPLAATLIWCAKESALKAIREGLRRDTRSVEVDVMLDGAEEDWNPFVVTCTETSRKYGGWWRRADRFVQTVAVDGRAAEPIALDLR